MSTGGGASEPQWKQVCLKKQKMMSVLHLKMSVRVSHQTAVGS